MKPYPLRRTVQALSSLVLVMVCVHFGANPARAAEPDATPVVIRYLNDPGFVPSFVIADALGFLKGTGVHLESRGDSPGGSKALAALASGSVDVVGAGTPAVINAIASGAEIFCVAPRAGFNKEANSKFYVLDSSPIKTAQDLKGKTIAVNVLGAHLDYTIRVYLTTHGLDRNDVKLVTVPGPRLNQTLRDGQADVVAVGAWQSPFAGKIAAEGSVRVLFTDHDVLGDGVFGNNVMKKAFIDQHPQAVKDLVTASAKAVDWAAGHPDDARKLVAQFLQKHGENPAGAVYWFGYGLPQHALYQDRDIQFWLNVMTREGKLKPGQFKPEDIASNKYNGYLQHLQN